MRSPSEPKRVKTSTFLDPDVLEWLRTSGRRRDRSVNYVVREILRAAMSAESEQREEAQQP